MYRCDRRVIAIMSIATFTVGVTGAWAQDATRQARGSVTSTIGTMAAGMGGAFVAVAQDATALYWNPAGLARQQGFTCYNAIGAETQNLHVGAEVQDVVDIVTADDYVTRREFNLIRSVAQRNTGIPVSASAGAFSGFTVDNYALGAYAMGGADGQFVYTAGAAAAPFDERVDWVGTGFGQGAVGFGYGWTVSDTWDAGATAKLAAVARGAWTGYTGYYAQEDDADLVTDDTGTDEDTALSADVGAIHHCGDGARWAFVIRNLISPSFNLGGESFELDPSIDIGYARYMDNGDIFAADLHNLTGANNAQRALAVGFQKRISRNFDLRLGLNDQGMSVGLRARLGFAAIEFALAPDFKDRAVTSLVLDF